MRSRERLLLLTALRARPLRVAAPLVVGVFVALGASSARAQDPFAAAEGARTEARLEEAAAEYRRVLESGELGLSEVAHAHLRLAELAFLGEELEAGTRHLGYALALRPDAPVTEGPPSMQEAAAAILVERGQRSLRVVLEISDERSPIVVDVRDAPPGLVRTLEVRGPSGWSRTFAWDGEARSLEPPPESRPLGARILDAYGNALGAAGVWPSAEIVPAPLPPIAPALEPPAPVEEEEEEGGEDILENPWLWVAIGVVLVVAGVAIGFTATGERFVVGAPVAP